jgi:predicted dehydrogenase
MDEVRIGFVGTGGIAQNHIGQLSEIPEAKVVAVCDINPEAARKTAEPLGADIYAGSSELIDKAEIDVLYVCVPPHAHGEIETAAAEKGLHLFVEKPVNLYIDQGVKAAEAIKKAGVFSQVGYSMRYRPPCMQLKEFLSDKEVGTAHAFRWSQLPRTPWWPKYDQGGGQLVEMTTHQVDLLRWVMGEVRAVSASYSFDRLHRDEEGVTVPDSQAVVLHFESGASATVNTSCALKGAWKGDMSFVIKDALVLLGKESIELQGEGAYDVPPVPEEAPGIDACFVKGILDNDASFHKSPYEDGLKSAAVCAAANRSAENGGKLVTLEEMLK